MDISIAYAYGNIAIFFILILMYAFGLFFTFTKMGYDNAWWLFIPVLNIFFIMDFIEKPIWLGLILILPIPTFLAHQSPALALIVLVIYGIIQLYISVMMSIRVAQTYGRSYIFAAFLFFFGSIFYVILAFSHIGEKQGLVDKGKSYASDQVNKKLLESEQDDMEEREI